MKWTLSGIFRHYCATVFTPLAILGVAPSTQAQTAAKVHQVPALGQAIELQSQGSIEPHPQGSNLSRRFSFSSLQASFLGRDRADSPSALLAQNSTDAAPTTDTSGIPDYLQNQKPHRVFIGPEIFYRNYNEEKITPDFKSFESGFLYGVKLQYDYVKRSSVYVGADFRYDRGQTDYSGGLQDIAGNNLGAINGKTDNEFFNFEGRLGYTFKADKIGRFLLTPYVGYGYQQWNRNLLGGDFEVPGLGLVSLADATEDYSWNYLAGGLRAEYRPSRRFTVGMNFKLMGMLNGTVDTQSGGQPTGTLDLGERLQAEVEFPLTYHLVDKPKSSIDVRFTPFYRSQNIGRGAFRITSVDAQGNAFGALEPASTADVYGATFGVVFGF
jgi:hypothetical protein